MTSLAFFKRRLVIIQRSIDRLLINKEYYEEKVRLTRIRKVKVD